MGANILTSGGKFWVNSLNSAKLAPISMLPPVCLLLFKSTLKIAWVAHAFWIVWFAKNIFSLASKS